MRAGVLQDVSGNEIVALPDCIGELCNLRDLNVRRNHLQSLPDGMYASVHGFDYTFLASSHCQCSIVFTNCMYNGVGVMWW